MTTRHGGDGRGLALALTAVLLVAVELSSGLPRRREAAHRDALSRPVLTVLFGAGVALLAVAPKIAPSAGIGPTGVCLAVGETALVLAAGLRLWAIRTLGRYFTREVMVSADQPVITAGPYGIVRHPSYTALLLYAVGFGVVAANWLGLAAITALWGAALVYRIRVEEAALSSVVGEEYRAYAARHKRLLPGVW